MQGSGFFFCDYGRVIGKGDKKWQHTISQVIISFILYRDKNVQLTPRIANVEILGNKTLR